MLPSPPVRRQSIALENSLLKVFLLLSIFTLSFIDLHNAPFVSGVITELRMNEGTGTTTADGSGNNHPGTLTPTLSYTWSLWLKSNSMKEWRQIYFGG